ncbi:YciI family protein [Amycolatopsis alba]|uniref:YciI family protein n=1 Tax=Amycolatopsis alba DSM 44262 TaxID=1125972 RepID=A0A229RWY7_AMYAL|nr:YciI family protein [Amycolatopsis alba]OXM51197.1 YciI family protein [Amycolatopsis alba DSM 44262]
MRYMIIIKADEDSEAGKLPPMEAFTAMAKFNQEMHDAGILLSGEGLQQSSKGARVTIGAAGTTVTDGPFTEAKELVGGFWIVDVPSRAEAIEWAKRCPTPPNSDTVLEVRKILEAEDFGEAFTPELQENEQRMRDEIAERS